MNSAARRLLFFFFSFAALTACDDPNEIGIDLQDENLIGTEFTDAAIIETGTVLLNDSILSYRTPAALVGQYLDPVLGKTRATLIAEVGLGGTNISFGNNSRADSLVLTLDYNFKYADTLKTMTVNVHRLTGAFEERMSYFTNTPFAFDATPIGSQAFQPRVDVVEAEGGVKTKKTRLLRIKLNPELANQFLTQTFADQASFLNFFRGIALTVPDDANASIVSFNLASTSSTFVLHYTAEDGTKKQHAFVLGSGGYFTQLAADRTGTAVATLQSKGSIVSATETGGDSYVQAGTQLLTKLTFPNLASLTNTEGNIIINRAELIVPVKANSAGNNLPVPPQMVLYETNAENRILRDAAGTARTIQQDGVNLNTTAFPAVMSYIQKNGKTYYSLNITNYVQSVILGQKPNNGLLMGAAAVSAGANNTRTSSFELNPYRAILTNTEASPVKLLIYYSKLK